MKILFYDIETTYLQARVWRLGDQVIRHDQLMNGRMAYDIICITYGWYDETEVHAMDWGYETQDSRPMLKAFDEIIKQADFVIGKNSDHFDNKHLNFHRMMNSHEPLPQWMLATDDLQKQFKKFFGTALPSQGLDYISKLMGLGGKIKMEMSQWIDIVEKRRPEALTEMVEYGKKDVADLRAIWKFAEAHIEPKYNKVPNTKKLVCDTCGSNRIHKRGTRVSEGSIIQRWYCLNHGGYAGRTVIK